MNKATMHKPAFDLDTDTFRTDTFRTDTLRTDALRTEVHALAEAAFHRHLISGYGDSEYPDEYQIVHEGKPRHLPLSRARSFLAKLMQRANR